MTEQLARYEVGAMAETERAAMALFQSKFFSDVTSQSQAIVKVMAGAEIGIGPFASMNGIHVIQGKPTYGANILAAKVKGSGKYDYRVLVISEMACELEFFQGTASLGKSSFTIADAKKSGTKNIDKFPRNMLFARAISNGIKWFCPDVLGGVTAYVPEEFGAIVDDNNNIVVDAVSTPTPQPEPAKVTPAPADTLDEDYPPLPEEPAHEMTLLEAMDMRASNGAQYGERSDKELSYVLNNAKSPADKREAARLILADRAIKNATPA